MKSKYKQIKNNSNSFFQSKLKAYFNRLFKGFNPAPSYWAMIPIRSENFYKNDKMD